MKCATYEDICIKYERILKINHMHDKFDEDKINHISILIFNIHCKRSDKTRPNRTIQSNKIPHNPPPPQIKQDTSKKDQLSSFISSYINILICKYNNFLDSHLSIENN